MNQPPAAPPGLAVQIAAPATPALTLAQAKDHLRVDQDDTSFDNVLTLLLAAAQAHVAAMLGRSLITQTWQATFAAPDWLGRLQLDAWFPLQSVLSVQILVAGVYAIQDPSTWVYRQQQPGSGIVRPLAPPAGAGKWPAADIDEAAFKLTYRAGYGDTAASIPPPILAAILLVLGDLFTNRDAVRLSNVQDNPAVQRLLAPFAGPGY